MAHFYKNIRDSQVKVGGFVLVCVVIVFFSYSWLNDWFVGNRYAKYSVLFDSVSTLDKGGSVYFRGMRVGKIGNMTIRADGVLTEVFVENSIQITDTASFVIKDKDMMGTKSLEIIPAEGGQPLREDRIYTGSSLPGFSELISNVNNLMEQVDRLIAQFDGEESLFDKLDGLLTGVDKTLGLANTVLINVNRSDMYASFTELKKASIALNALVEGNDELLANILVAGTNTLTKVDSLIVHAEGLLAKLHPTEDSSVNKLLTDEELYTSIISSIKELETLINDIKANPRRYFKFSVF